MSSHSIQFILFFIFFNVLACSSCYHCAVNIPLAGEREMLELKLDTDEDDEDVFFLLV